MDVRRIARKMDIWRDWVCITLASVAGEKNQEVALALDDAYLKSLSIHARTHTHRTFQSSWDNMLQPGESSQVLRDQLDSCC